MNYTHNYRKLNGDTKSKTIYLKELVLPSCVKWIDFVWLSEEWKIDLISDLMSTSWEIKAFQPASPMIDVDDNGSNSNDNLFTYIS